jgi:hypothetical protein
LRAEERKWGKHAMQAEELRAEIERRNGAYKVIGVCITTVCAIIAVVFMALNYFHPK